MTKLGLQKFRLRNDSGNACGDKNFVICMAHVICTHFLSKYVQKKKKKTKEL